MRNARLIALKHQSINVIASGNGVLQRACACGNHVSGGECEGTLQHAAINPSPVHDVPPIVHEVLRSPGQPLDGDTRVHGAALWI